MSPNLAFNLTISNNGGSVEHYYHFLLGFLFPLAVVQLRLQKMNTIGPIYVRSCGPMDRMLNEVDFPHVRIIDKHEHIQNGGKTHIDGLLLLHRTVPGMDFTNGNYPREYVIESRNIILNHLANKAVIRTDLNTDQITSQNEKRVLLINRSIDSYYYSEKSEKKTSGLQRRSISNFTDVENSIRSVFSNVRSVILETATLAEQISLFGSSDIIVAQHGAALANVVWCKPNTRVIEIVPEGYRVNCFPPLSRLIGLEHRRVRQDGFHGKCEINDLVLNSIQ